MEFTTDKYGGARFVVPDDPTIYQLLDYDSQRYNANGLPDIWLLWEMAKTLITEWESAALPDKDISLADTQKVPENANKAVGVIKWAGLLVSAYRRGLENVPKN